MKLSFHDWLDKYQPHIIAWYLDYIKEEEE